MDRAREVEALVAGLGRPLPADYLEFLRTFDGFDGVMGANYVVLWTAARVLELHVDPIAWEQDIVCIGSNGATEYLAILRDADGFRYVLMNACGASDVSELIPLGTTFADFLVAVAQPWLDRVEA